MAELDNTIVKGNLVATEGIRNVAPLSWADSTALPQQTGVLQYVLGIEAFASGGKTYWQSKDTFLSGVVKSINSATPDSSGNVTIGTLPAHTSSDAGKILTIDSSNNVVWSAIYQGAASGTFTPYDGQ